MSRLFFCFTMNAYSAVAYLFHFFPQIVSHWIWPPGSSSRQKRFAALQSSSHRFQPWQWPRSHRALLPRPPPVKTGRKTTARETTLENACHRPSFAPGHAHDEALWQLLQPTVVNSHVLAEHRTKCHIKQRNIMYCLPLSQPNRELLLCYISSETFNSLM